TGMQEVWYTPLIGLLATLHTYVGGPQRVRKAFAASTKTVGWTRRITRSQSACCTGRAAPPRTTPPLASCSTASNRPPTFVLWIFRFRRKPACKLLKELVGASGFEPPASWSRTRRSTRLSHAP